MSQLTEDQKQQQKMADRAADRIQQTWNLFCMYLGNDKRPAEALELAQEAVAVWADFQDGAEIEPPEIERPDFVEQMTGALAKMTEHMKLKPEGSGMVEIHIKDEAGVDAEFIPVSE